MTIALAPEVEEKLKAEAARQGLSLDEYANRVLDEKISEAERERRESLIALLQSWIDEDEASEDEYYDEEFLQRLDAERPEGSKLFPPELKGISW